MSGNHRADQSKKARIAVAGALTAGTLLLAPAGAAVFAAPGIAQAAPPPGTPTDGGGTEPGTGVTAPTVHKTVLRMPGLKIEIKDTVGDHKLPKIKFVPFPRLHFPR